MTIAETTEEIPRRPWTESGRYAAHRAAIRVTESRGEAARGTLR